MGKKASPQLDRFIAALHRRLIVIRVLETTALGAAGGCAVGAALIPLLYWRDIPALPPTAGAVLLGAAMGFVYRLAHAPTKLQAATEADRQLNLADLLGTALTVGGRRRESDRDETAQPWLQTVLTLADAACRAHTPAQVILHRLHARAWAGIAIAAALVVSVAALTTPDPTARAASTRGAGGIVRQGFPEELKPPAAGGNPRAMSRGQGLGPERESKTESSTAAESPEGGGKGDAGADSTSNSTATSNTGQGGGTARATNPPGSAKSPPVDAAEVPPSPAGDPASGNGASTTRPTTTGNPAGTAGGPGRPAPASPPWHSPTWSDDTRRAQEAIESGRVPDDRRGLVRDYFDRR